MPVTGAIAAVASVGVGAYGAYNSSQSSGMANYESSTVFNEQQQYAKQLQQLIANPNSVTSLPGYQFQLNQGATTLANQLGAQGLHGSGAEGAALVQYGQNYASSALTQQEQLLSSLSGLTASSSPSQLTGAATQASANSFSQIGQLLGTLGYGAGRVNTAGGLQSLFGGTPQTAPNFTAGTPLTYE